MLNIWQWVQKIKESITNYHLLKTAEYFPLYEFNTAAKGAMLD